MAVGHEYLACVPVEQPDEAQRVDQDASDSETCLGPQAPLFRFFKMHMATCEN